MVIQILLNHAYSSATAAVAGMIVTILMAHPRLQLLQAFQGGIPCEVVDSMQPESKIHGSPQPSSSGSPSPYGVRAFNEYGELTSSYIRGRVYTIEIYGRCGNWTPIRGFLLVARERDTGDVAGTFLKEDSNYWQASHYPCRDTKLGSVTHYAEYDRRYPVKFQWRTDRSTKVDFEVIVFRSQNIYWKSLTWPEPASANCHCEDKQDADCKRVVKAYKCNTEFQLDNCAYSCNNCSSPS